MQLYIASALAFAAGVAVAAAWPTIRTRASYWAGYATGRYTKLCTQHAAEALSRLRGGAR